MLFGSHREVVAAEELETDPGPVSPQTKYLVTTSCRIYLRIGLFRTCTAIRGGNWNHHEEIQHRETKPTAYDTAV